jgi:hypothetical protein
MTKLLIYRKQNKSKKQKNKNKKNIAKTVKLVNGRRVKRGGMPFSGLDIEEVEDEDDEEDGEGSGSEEEEARSAKEEEVAERTELSAAEWRNAMRARLPAMPPSWADDEEEEGEEVRRAKEEEGDGWTKVGKKISYELTEQEIAEREAEQEKIDEKKRNLRKEVLDQIKNDIESKAMDKGLNINLTIDSYKPELFDNTHYMISFDNKDIGFASRDDKKKSHLTISPLNSERYINGSHITLFIPKVWASNYALPMMHIYRDGQINFKWQKAHKGASMYPKPHYEINMKNHNIADKLYDILNREPLKLEPTGTWTGGHPNTVNLGVKCNKYGWHCAQVRDEDSFKQMIRNLKILLDAMDTTLQENNSKIKSLNSIQGGSKTRKKYRHFKNLKIKSTQKYNKNRKTHLTKRKKQKTVKKK